MNPYPIIKVPNSKEYGGWVRETDAKDLGANN